jgi:membrane protein YdbS with pleckstrin-like domain
MDSEHVRELRSELKKQITTMITAAFGFVAALSWNDAIKATINAFIPTQNAWPFMVLNAVIVTIIAVGVIYLISRSGRKYHF